MLIRSFLMVVIYQVHEGLGICQENLLLIHASILHILWKEQMGNMNICGNSCLHIDAEFIICFLLTFSKPEKKLTHSDVKYTFGYHKKNCTNRYLWLYNDISSWGLFYDIRVLAIKATKSFYLQLIIVFSYNKFTKFTRRTAPFQYFIWCHAFKDADSMLIPIIMLQSFGIGWVVGSWPLFWALFISFVLGTAYSINVSLFSFSKFSVHFLQ